MLGLFFIGIPITIALLYFLLNNIDKGGENK